jgi:2-polyprenyl-6-methoxyphenol hydroxylase-like FAD-dependent oxidoreductase
MTAILLKSHSYNVHVLERSDAAALQSQAAGIRAGPQVHAFIAKYIRNYPTYFTTTDKAEIVDKKGDVVTVIPAKDPLRLTTWRRLYEMFKRELLTDDEDNGKADARYETGKRVEGVIDVGDKMMVTYCDLKSDTVHSVHVDFVIAADGANSKVRSILPPGSAPQYVGYVTWRGRVPENIVSTETRDALKGRCVLMRVERGYLVS